ncbi:MAG TPA: hypothetical protein DEG69_11665 [Flavobacteriaceae bacterium]|nr:hypothetical protein [Flavobacteriaceae bacterium]
MKQNLFLHHHLGLGDHICLNGMVLSFLKTGKFEKIFLFCKEKYLSNLNILYTQDNIKLIPVDNDPSKELHCVNKFVSENISQHDKFLRVGFCNIPENKTCDVYFYEIAGVPYQERFDGFRIERDDKEEQRVLEKLNASGEDYIFVHDDAERGFIINVESDYKIIRNDPTESVFHYGKIIENAKEFHCIESCIRCYSEHLDTKNISLFHHNSVRPNILSSRKKWITV